MSTGEKKGLQFRLRLLPRNAGAEQRDGVDPVGDFRGGKAGVMREIESTIEVGFES